MTITNDKKFPHAFKLKTLGGSSSLKGKQYHWRYEEELSCEYSIIMEAITERPKLGSNSQIHNLNAINDTYKK